MSSKRRRNSKSPLLAHSGFLAFHFYLFTVHKLPQTIKKSDSSQRTWVMIAYLGQTPRVSLSYACQISAFYLLEKEKRSIVKTFALTFNQAALHSEMITLHLFTNLIEAPGCPKMHSGRWICFPGLAKRGFIGRTS